ncbi:MAG: hypothetical protein WDN24_04040 [Sphingomonas sp.]
MPKEKAVPENPHRGTTLDRFLEEEGVLTELQAEAIKEVAAWQSPDADADAARPIRRPDQYR